MPESALHKTVDALFAALNEPNPELVRAWCTDDGWSAVQRHLKEAEGRFATFPAHIVNGDRALVRGMIAPEDGLPQPQPIWFGLLQDGAAWKLDTTFVRRGPAVTWARGADTGEADTAPAEAETTAKTTTPPAPAASGFAAVVEAISDAMNAGEAELMALTAAGAWESDASPSNLLQFAERGGITLQLGDGQHQAGGRAALAINFLAGGVPRDNTWLLLVDEDGWKAVGTTEEATAAALYVAHRVDGAPSWHSLPDEPSAAKFVEDAVTKLGTEADPPFGSDAEAWATLIEAGGDDSLTPRAGEAKTFPRTGRALAQLGFYGADDPEWAEDDRWALLERAGDEWRLIAVRYMKGVGTLLEDIEPEWPEPDPSDAPADEAPKGAAGPKKALADLLNAAGVTAGPDGKPDISTLTEDQIKALAPQILEAFMGVVGQGVASNNAPDGVFDLAQERAKRGQRAPIDAEEDVSKALKEAFSGFVGKSAGKSDKLDMNADFLKANGPEMFATLFTSLAKSIIPDNLEVPVPVEDGLKDDLDNAETDAGQRTVNVNLDIGSLLGGLFSKAIEQARGQGEQDMSNTEGDEPE